MQYEQRGNAMNVKYASLVELQWHSKVRDPTSSPTVPRCLCATRAIKIIILLVSGIKREINIIFKKKNKISDVLIC